ncbi:MAG: DUF507 family protein [Nitrospiraceae bacterium]|nr:DUF507 family protein [Nitrospiraceae bacterium]
MRIPKSWVRPITEKIVGELTAEGLVSPMVPLAALMDEAEAIITDELMVEDRLNDEVREVLRRYEGEIEKGNLDYRRMFDLTKQRLVRERNLVL